MHNCGMLDFIFVTFCLILPCFSILDVELGKPCASHADCAIAYSRCDSSTKICSCLKGFAAEQKSGLCKPPAFLCPTHQSTPKVSTKFCTEHTNYSTGESQHNCSQTNEYCLIHPYSKAINGDYVGTCCTDPPKDVAIKMVCPLGEANINGTCPTYDGPADAPAPLDKIRTCSYSDEECVSYKGVQICCPRPCLGSSPYFSVLGRCYDYSQIGQSCVYDAQCAGRSFCLPVGKSTTAKTCQCKTELVKNHSPPYCSEK